MLSTLRSRSFTKMIKTGLILAVIILIIGLLATSYSSIPTFLLGILLLPLGWFLLWLYKKFNNLIIKTKILIISFFLILIFTPIFFYFQELSFQTSTQYPVGNTQLVLGININKYHASIKAENNLLNFKLEEDFIFKFESSFDINDNEDQSVIVESLNRFIKNNFDLYNQINSNYPSLLQGNNIAKLISKNIPFKLRQERTISSEGAGFALRKVSFVPLSEFGLSNKNSSSPLKIEIKNIPSGSFYRVDDLDNVEAVPFTSNKTTVKFSTEDIDKEISFTYFSKPYNYFSSILKPLAGISSIGNGLLIILGMISASIFKEVVKPFITEEVKEIFLVRIKEKLNFLVERFKKEKTD